MPDSELADIGPLFTEALAADAQRIFIDTEWKRDVGKDWETMSLSELLSQPAFWARYGLLSGRTQLAMLAHIKQCTGKATGQWLDPLDLLVCLLRNTKELFQKQIHPAYRDAILLLARALARRVLRDKVRREFIVHALAAIVLATDSAQMRDDGRIRELVRRMRQPLKQLKVEEKILLSFASPDDGERLLGGIRAMDRLSVTEGRHLLAAFWWFRRRAVLRGNMTEAERWGRRSVRVRRNIRSRKPLPLHIPTELVPILENRWLPHPAATSNPPRRP
jgi:hypothetical protein